MAVEFKVWVTVERVNDDADSYTDLGEPDSLGTFDTPDEACAFVRTLNGWVPDLGSSYQAGSTFDWLKELDEQEGVKRV